jgi:hypothetical protein
VIAGPPQYVSMAVPAALHHRITLAALLLLAARCAGGSGATLSPPAEATARRPAAGPPAPLSHDRSPDAGAAADAPRCAPDPQVSWLDPRDRACAGDDDCVFVVGDGCEMFGISRAGAARPEYAAHHCLGHWPDLPAALTCMCAVPGIETRCGEGCCQRRFLGTDGPWLP